MIFIISAHLWLTGWTLTLNSEFNKYLPYLERNSDINQWCHGYENMDHAKRISVWSELVKRIAFYESSWDEKQYTWEPTLGVYSIGLMQLSREDGWNDWCDYSRIDNGTDNLLCAVPYMVSLIGKDHMIADGHNLKTAKGLSHYWQVCWHREHYDEIRSEIGEYCGK